MPRVVHAKQPSGVLYRAVSPPPIRAYSEDFLNLHLGGYWLTVGKKATGRRVAYLFEPCRVSSLRGIHQIFIIHATTGKTIHGNVKRYSARLRRSDVVRMLCTKERMLRTTLYACPSLSCFLSLFNTLPLHSLKHDSQWLNRRNRELVLVTGWSKELILFKVCRG